MIILLLLLGVGQDDVVARDRPINDRRSVRNYSFPVRLLAFACLQGRPTAIDPAKYSFRDAFPFLPLFASRSPFTAGVQNIDEKKIIVR